MGKTRLLFFITAYFTICLTGAGQNQARYTMHQSNMGGGGYITGLLINPINPDIVYARCDVAGMFKSADGGKTWEAINNGMTECHHHSVETFAIHPADPDILFRCSGEARDHKMTGTIHKSVDGGKNWKKVSDDVDYFGNGTNRMFGEKIAFDPFRPNRMITAGYVRGVFISDDCGETWKHAGLKNEVAGTVAFHPLIKNRVFFGTLSGIAGSENKYLFNGKFDRPKTGRLYQSDDAGKTWNLIYESDDIAFSEIAFHASNPDIFVVASVTSAGYFKTIDGGHSFKTCTNGLPEKSHGNTIVADPHQPGRLYTAIDRRGGMGNIPLVPIYVSDDFGENWRLLRQYKRSDFFNYPEYIRTEEWIGWAISKIRIDPKKPGKLLMSNWYGVSVSENGGITWDANHYRGTETTCIENVVTDQGTGNTFFAIADHQPNLSVDGGKNFLPFVRPVYPKPVSRSTAVVPSRHFPGITFYSIGGRKAPLILRTPDLGKSYDIIWHFKEGLFVQALKESATDKGKFYAYLDGNVSDSAGLWISTNEGKSWQFKGSPFLGYIKTLPHHSEWIESEVLSVVYNQRKNVCGTNQLLCVDPFKAGSVLMGEWTEGLFYSSDDGKTWNNISNGLPFKKDTASILVSLAADEKEKGVFYAGFIHEGLWRTKNYGKKWEKIYPLDNSVFNASSVVAGGKNDTDLFVACEPLYWSKCPSSVLYSPDRGKSWIGLYDGTKGALRWKGISCDRRTGTLFGITCGNGAFYFERTP